MDSKKYMNNPYRSPDFCLEETTEDMTVKDRYEELNRLQDQFIAIIPVLKKEYGTDLVAEVSNIVCALEVLKKRYFDSYRMETSILNFNFPKLP